MTDVQVKSEDLLSDTEPGGWLAMLLGGSSTFALRQIDAAILAKQESGPTIKLGNFSLGRRMFLPGQEVSQSWRLSQAPRARS
jgi:hypothetical protein